MKKMTIILCLGFLISLTAKGQLNPIKNLQWNHWYDTPHNCFHLWWTQPDSSLTDSLVGYNIYRDDTLYMFTTYIGQSCIIPCSGGQAEAFCDFLDYTGHSFIGQFYIHVTAVYNHDHIESIFTDSIFNYGIAIGIKDLSLNETLTILKIIQENNSIMIELNNTVESGEMIISNLFGQTISMFALKNQRTAELDISNITSGLYLINLKTNKVNLTRKIIIK